MNTDNFVQMMQKGFHITLGAASFLVETATSPDQQQRDGNLSKLQAGNFDSLSEEWATLGAQKEQEGRTFVESIVPGGFPGMPTDSAPASNSTVSGPSIPVDIQEDLQTIMTELTAIRASLKGEDT